jgi:hypothetical protein
MISRFPLVMESTPILLISQTGPLYNTLRATVQTCNSGQFQDGFNMARLLMNKAKPDAFTMPCAAYKTSTKPHKTLEYWRDEVAGRLKIFLTVVL